MSGSKSTLQPGLTPPKEAPDGHDEAQARQAGPQAKPAPEPTPEVASAPEPAPEVAPVEKVTATCPMCGEEYESYGAVLCSPSATAAPAACSRPARSRWRTCPPSSPSGTGAGGEAAS